MADLTALKAELKEAKFQLRMKKQVTWGDAAGGMVAYGDQLNRVLALQKQIQEAES